MLSGGDGRVRLSGTVGLQEHVIGSGICGVAVEHWGRGVALALVKGRSTEDEVIRSLHGRGELVARDGLGLCCGSLGGRLAGGLALGGLGSGGGGLFSLGFVRRSSTAFEVFKTALELLACRETRLVSCLSRLLE